VGVKVGIDVLGTGKIPLLGLGLNSRSSSPQATRWENSIKAVECESCGWIQLAEDRAHLCEHGNEIFGSLNTGNL